MGKCCWRACHPVTFSHTNSLALKLLSHFIFQCYRPQTWQFYFFFFALSFSVASEYTKGTKGSFLWQMSNVYLFIHIIMTYLHCLTAATVNAIIIGNLQ